MLSLLDSSVTVDQHNSAVTVVYKGNHAALLLESVRQDDPTEREIRFAHFLPVDIHRAQSSIKKFIELLKDFTADPRAAHVDRKMICVETRGELIAELRITHVTTTYPVSGFAKIRDLIARINDEFNKAVPIPQFQIRGEFINNETPAFNCRSWVRERLKMVDVSLPENFIDHTSSDTLGCDDSSSSPSGCVIL